MTQLFSGGLGANLAYTVDYGVEYTNIEGSFSSVATLSGSTVSVEVDISANPQGQPSVVLSSPSLTIGSLDPGFSGYII